MSTDTSTADLQQFHDFLGGLREQGECRFTPEESVTEFRAYQEQLARFQRTVELSLEQSDRGESKPLDVDSLLQRVHRRLEARKASE